jgi:uncharacterized membrane protein
LAWGALMEDREIQLERERLAKAKSDSKLLVEKAEASRRNANQAVQRAKELAKELKARLAHFRGQEANTAPQRRTDTGLACRTQR